MADGEHDTPRSDGSNAAHGAAGSDTHAGGGFRRAGGHAARAYRAASAQPNPVARIIALVVVLALAIALALLLLPVLILGLLVLAVLVLWARTKALFRARSSTGVRAAGRENVRVVRRMDR